MKSRVIFYGLAALAGSGIAFSMSGCAQKVKALPIGSFRVTVKDLVSYPDMQVKQIIIEKEGSGELQVDADVQHHGFKITNVFSPQSDHSASVAELICVADMVPSPHQSPNTLHLANQITASGSVSYGSATWQTSRTSESTTPLLSAIKSGVYPVGVPLQIGPMRGKPIILTVSEGKR